MVSKGLTSADDAIVIELIKKQITQLEKDGTSWILEGFPRTKAQALSLQRMGIIPDKFIHLSTNKTT
jgi:adenylate kinase